MSLIGPAIRRMIVITLVCGLSAGMWCSPLAIAATMQRSQPAACHSLAPSTNSFAWHRSTPRPTLRCGGGMLADRPELEPTDQFADGESLSLDRPCDAAAIAAHRGTAEPSLKTMARTLFSLRVCWRV